jgi:hypothetical protein
MLDFGVNHGAFIERDWLKEHSVILVGHVSLRSLYKNYYSLTSDPIIIIIVQRLFVMQIRIYKKTLSNF